MTIDLASTMNEFEDSATAAEDCRESLCDATSDYELIPPEASATFGF